LAGIGETVVGSISGPAADYLVCYDANSLAESAKVLLDGRITWGPYSAGDRVVLQTDDGMLRAYDASGKAVTSPLKLDQGQLVPGVKMIGETMVVTSKVGWLAAVDASTGALIGKTDLGQPLSALPLEVGKRLLVPGTEGLVYITEIPSGNESP
jgi:outer membrane protein assembly factor BamB